MVVEYIGACAPAHRVGPCPADQDVVSVTSIQLVVTTPAMESIIAAKTVDGVVAFPAPKIIVSVITREGHILRGTWLRGL